MSTLIISCDKSSQTEPEETQNQKPSLAKLPQISQASNKIVHSVSLNFVPGAVVVTESTGEEIKPCVKTNIGDGSKEYSDTNEDTTKCNVIILTEYKDYLEFLEKMRSFNQPVLMKKEGEIQQIQTKLVAMGLSDSSCGSTTDTGGDQHGSKVDCFSPQAQQCAGWVANGWTWVKDYPPCNEFYP